RKPRRRAKQRVAPRGVHGLEALITACTVGAKHGSGVFARAGAPQQRIGLETAAFAYGAWRVRAVLREQHANVHLVGLALEPGEKATHAVPLRLPLAGPRVLSLEDPATMFGLEQLERRVERNAELRRVLFEITLALDEAL